MKEFEGSEAYVSECRRVSGLSLREMEGLERSELDEFKILHWMDVLLLHLKLSELSSDNLDLSEW